MKDPESAESKEKSNFRFSDFYFWSYGYFCSKNCRFSMNFHDNLKNKNRKIDFSLDSAHFASFIKTGAKLRVGGLHMLSWEITGVGGPASHNKKNRHLYVRHYICRHFVCRHLVCQYYVPQLLRYLVILSKLSINQTNYWFIM